MEEFTQTIAVGAGDLQHAALAEARRIMREAKGDRGAAADLMYERLREQGWISESERDVLVKMRGVGTGSPTQQKRGRPDATAAYLTVRGMHDQLIAKGGTSQVALVLAAGLAGSYEPEPSADGTTVVYKTSDPHRDYQAVLGAAGAAIGGLIGGAAGAGAGGLIGGAIGYIVDDCKD